MVERLEWQLDLNEGRTAQANVPTQVWAVSVGSIADRG